MEKKYFADIVINKEKLSNGQTMYVAHCTTLGIASQGKTTEEALKNIKEAITIYLEDQKEEYNDLGLTEDPPFFSFVEITKNTKAASIVR